VKRLALSLVLLFSIVTPCRTETVNVKYRGPVDLSHFSCKAIDHSSFINRVCYDAANGYMIVLLKETYYHYCDVDNATHAAFIDAVSMGRYFNAAVKGHFDCRIGHVPAY
jgi:hypothetical protein